MTTLPSSATLTSGTATEGTAKTWFGDVRQFIADLLGTDSANHVAAMAALGVPLNSKVDKSAAYTVAATDRGVVINATTGTWTLSVTAAATLGDGFVFGVLNSGAGAITIDPNASEQVDGAATKVIAAGQFAVVYCDGSKFATTLQQTILSTPIRQRTLASGTTYTTPSDVKALRVFVCGSIGGSSNATGGKGGAGYAEKYYASPAASYSYAIGAAGSTSGTAGGTTSFDTVSVTGSGGVTGSAGSAGGSASGGDFNANGGTGGNGSFATPTINACGGGGGGAGSRAGAGGNGSAGVSGTYMGAGGGTGGNNASAKVGGAAATTLSATALTGIDDAFAFSFAAGADGYDGTQAAGSGGANGTETTTLSALFPMPGATGGWGSYGPGSGSAGKIVIWEYLK